MDYERKIDTEDIYNAIHIKVREISNFVQEINPLCKLYLHQQIHLIPVACKVKKKVNFAIITIHIHTQSGS